MAELIVLMGIPGSGKSTMISRFNGRMADGYLEVVSPDQVRKGLTGDINDQSKNDEVFEHAHFAADYALVSGRDVIFDATNVTKEARHNLVEIANKHEATKKLIVFSNYQAAWERNAARPERVVPEHAMIKMTRNFTKSLSQIGFEDWDIIEFVRD